MFRQRKRLWAILLSAALLVTQLPVAAMAETNPPEDGSIQSFAALDSGVANQAVPVGTLESELNLPGELTAAVYHVSKDTTIPDAEGTGEERGDASTTTPGDAENSAAVIITMSTEQIPVTWECDPAYDGDTPVSYVFTADVGGYALSDGVKPPQITVTTYTETAPSLDALESSDYGVILLVDPKPDDMPINSGYSFDPSTGKLTVFTDDGTREWRYDTSIGVDEKTRVNAIKSLEVQSGVESIRNGAFENCEKLNRVDLSACSNLTTIESGAFSNCRGMSWPLDLSACTNLTTIGNSAFKYCQALRVLDLSACTKLTTIGYEAFSSCDYLEALDLACTNLTTIGGEAFSYCDNLETLTLPSTAPRLGADAFYHSENLATIFVPKGATGYTVENGWPPVKLVSGAVLTDLDINEGTLVPAFSYRQETYTVSVGNDVEYISVKPISPSAGTTIIVNGDTVASNEFSDDIPLTVGTPTRITIVAKNCNSDQHTYTVIVTRAGMVTVPVDSVEPDRTALTLHQGGVYTLRAKVKPGNATDQAVSWASSNTGVATVDGSGEVTAVSPGTATITVTTMDGGKTAKCKVTVKAPAPLNCSGTVTDKDTPVSGATLRTTDRAYSATTGANGAFTIELPAGNWTLEVADYSPASAGDYLYQALHIGRDDPRRKTELTDISVTNVSEGIYCQILDVYPVAPPESLQKGAWVKLTGDYSTAGSSSGVSLLWTLPNGKNADTYFTQNKGGEPEDGAVGEQVWLHVGEDESSGPLGITLEASGGIAEKSVDFSIQVEDVPVDNVFTDPNSGLGSYTWSGQVVGEGQVEITGITFDPDSAGEGAKVTLSNPLRATASGKKYTAVSIAAGAFADNAQLESLSLPDTVETVGTNSFQNCTGLKQIFFYNKDTEIADGAFSGAGSVTLYAGLGGAVASYARANGIPFRDIAHPDGWECYSFANATSDFFRPGERRNYPVTDRDWEQMKRNLDQRYGNSANSQYNLLRDFSSSNWGGSCYGIAVTEGLFNTGEAHLGLTGLPGAPYPRDNAGLRSAVNFYFLTQLLPDFQDTQHWGCKTNGSSFWPYQRTDWTGDLKALVDQVERGGPGLFCYQFVEGGTAYGHAILLESVISHSGDVYTLGARDNRFPGSGGKQVTSVVIDLGGNGGKGSLKITPTGYAAEEAVEFTFNQDFARFDDKMPLDRYLYVPAPENPGNIIILTPPADDSWIIEMGGGSTMESNPIAASNADKSIAIGSEDGKITLQTMIAASYIDENGDPQNAPSPIVYQLDHAEDLTFTPGAAGNRAAGSAWGLSYTTEQGFASFNAGSLTSATLAPNGTAKLTGVSGPLTVSTTAGDGTLIKVESANTAAGDFTLTPGADGATLNAPAGQYTVTTQKQDGYTQASTVVSDGSSTVNIATPETPDDPGPSGGGGGSGGGNPGSTVTVVTPQPTEQQLNPPAEGVVKPSATVDKNGTVKVSVSEQDIQSAIDKAVAQSKKDGKETNGIAVSIDLTGLKAEFNALPLTLSRTAYKKLVDAGVKYLSIKTPQISLSLDLETLKTIYNAATGDVTINAVKTENKELPSALQGRPAYDLTITTSGKTVSNFGKGYVAVSLPYTLQAGEQGGNLQMAYIDAAGKVQHITDSSYDVNSKALIGRTNHFTVFGIAQKPAPEFSDIRGHWAKDDILFVASRGLLNGTGDKVFSPNGSMTRGMFVTALWRLAGSPQASGGKDFTDVPTGTYYSDAVAWASSKGIVSGTTATTFTPDRAVTRQEMAAIMVNYAKAMDYTLPRTREAVTFTDNASIASWAADAVNAMQQAGVINGKDGNRFDPTGTATRAEVSAVLHRYVELVIDPATTQGWDRNDSGQWMYYENGKPATGVRTIDGTTYHFDAQGRLTKIDAMAPESKKYITYTVKKDDTLWSIAATHNCTVAEIVALNKELIENPNMILVGWELTIPQK